MKRPCPERLSVLLLCDDFRGHANTVLDHISALMKYSEHVVRTFNPRGLSDSRCLDLSEFDVVVIHYSVFVISDHYLSPRFRDKLREFEGLKVQFIQDEHRRVDEMAAMMRFLGIHVLFTLLPSPEIPKVYSDARLPGVVKVHSLAGYVPERLVEVEVPATRLRPVDIGYRGRTLPFWLGRVAQEKAWIGQGVLARADKYGLSCDIGWTEEDRIYGERWTKFLCSCKATLGTESGASITDFDGTVEKRTKDYLAEHPDADFHQLSRAMLESYEGNVRVNVISPRIFEAVALRTALILFPGDYSGIVLPWVHYIPLAKDFSNMDTVTEKLRDEKFLRAMTQTAYGDLVSSGRYSHRSFVREFDAVLAQYGRVYRTGRKVCYRLARVERPLTFAAKRVQKVIGLLASYVGIALKGGVALKLMVRTKGGRRILLRYMVDGEGRRSEPLGKLFRDVLKLAIVGRAQTSALRAKGPFCVSMQFDRDQGQLLFVSRPVKQTDAEASAKAGSMGNGSWPEEDRRELEFAVREGRVRTMVWNHAALGGRVHYALTPFTHLSLGFGEYDLHRFEALEGLARRCPEQTWDVLSSVLKLARS